MKPLKLLLIFLLFTTGYVQAQWFRQDAGTSEALNDVFCINADTVFAVGNAGVILKTTDGGENWIQKTSDFTGYLWKIRFANDTIGYAIGENGIIKTTDCGETWTVLNAEEDSLYSVYCVNKDTVYISGLHGIIKKTENGGQTWITLNTGLTETITNIQFVNDTLGYATVGTPYEDNYFLRTYDGGQNWQNKFMGGGGFFSLFFCNDSTGYIGGSGQALTTDYGESWQTTFYPYWSNSYSIYCNSVDTIWVAGWEAFNTEGGVVAKGISTGVGFDDWNWSSTTGFHEYYNSIYFANDTVGYVVGFVGDEDSGWEGLIKKITNGENISGIENLTEKKSFLVYPNPCNGKFTIKNLQAFAEPYSVSITDITGKTVVNYQLKNINCQHTINVSYLQPGIYFLKLSIDNDVIQTKKLIIQ